MKTQVRRSPQPRQRARVVPTPRIIGGETLRERTRELLDAVARRAYEIFDQRGRMHGRHEEDWLQAESELFQPAAVEVDKAGRHLMVRAQVAGFGPDELEVGVEPRRVTIVGERCSASVGEEGGLLSASYAANRIFRVVDLPDEVDERDATATISEGVLEIALRKAAAPRPRRAF